jgi:hypothetical protein
LFAPFSFKKKLAQNKIAYRDGNTGGQVAFGKSESFSKLFSAYIACQMGKRKDLFNFSIENCIEAWKT